MQKMKVSAFVLFILISERAFCIEPEPFKDEAVFQGTQLESEL